MDPSLEIPKREVKLPAEIPRTAFTDTQWACLAEVKHWLERSAAMRNVVGMHAVAKRFQPTPRRLLDVGVPGSSPLRVSLQAIPPVNTPYLCLSHCWGKKQHFVTTQETLLALHHPIDWELLPPLFQDFIVVARFLRFRYVWIDSLCIVQDDEEDWAWEARSMSGIYSGAFGVVAALDCVDNSERLFEGSVDSCLLRRAWVFQEMMLAGRIIGFQNGRVEWHSKDTSRYAQIDGDRLFSTTQSTGKTPFMEGGNTLSLIKTYSNSTWYDMVEIYSSLKLTYNKDRLPALQGISATISKVRGSIYRAGLWEDEIMVGLLWSCSQPSRSSQSAVAKAPSWSWASSDGGVKFALKHTPRRESSLAFVQGAIMPGDREYHPDEHGWGCLHMYARLFIVRRDTADPALATINLVLDVSTEIDLTQTLQDLSVWDSEDVDRIFALNLVYFLPLFVDMNILMGLYVRCVNHQLNVYERLGMASYRRTDEFETPMREVHATELSKFLLR